MGAKIAKTIVGLKIAIFGYFLTPISRKILSLSCQREVTVWKSEKFGLTKKNFVKLTLYCLFA